MRNLTSKQQNLLDLLIALNELESVPSNAFKTLSGRMLYYQMAKTFCPHRQLPSALKGRFGRLSERAIRERMRAFESEQLLMCHPGSRDARTRKLVPTVKFFNLLEEHLTRCQKALEARYFLIEK